MKIETSGADEGLISLLLRSSGWSEFESEKGRTLEHSGPVIVANTNPTGWVSQCAVRNANPFFHIAEAMWMLAGREDLDFLLTFNSTFSQFSDDGKTIRGSAYGRRWRTWFGKDQIEEIIKLLRRAPNSRQAVLTQWSVDDLGLVSKDLPCNLQTLFLVRDGRLDMTVTNRSNDLLWGMYGSNIVHFSVLHGYVAAMLDLEVGIYYQVSNCLHVYTDNPIYQRYVRNGFTPIFSRAWRPAPSVAVNSEDATLLHANLLEFFRMWDDYQEKENDLLVAGNSLLTRLYHTYFEAVEIQNKSRFFEIFLKMLDRWIQYKSGVSVMAMGDENALYVAGDLFIERRGKAATGIPGEEG